MNFDKVNKHADQQPATFPKNELLRTFIFNRTPLNCNCLTDAFPASIAQYFVNLRNKTNCSECYQMFSNVKCF